MRSKAYNIILFFLFVLASCSFLYYNKDYYIVSYIPLEVKPNPSNSNPLKLIWNRTWGDTVIPFPKSIEIDSLNNSYIAGYLDSPSGKDLFLLKYDAAGNFKWEEEWGGSGEDGATAMVINSTNNIYTVGVTKSFGSGGWDACLFKYNSSGYLLWDDIWGGIEDDSSMGIVIDSNNNIFVGGTTNSFGAGNYDIFLLKYNSSGDLLWNITWGSIEYETAISIALDSSDNIYLGGDFRHSGSYDLLLTKFDNNGNYQWNRTYSDVDASGIFKSMIIDSQDNIYLLANVVQNIGGNIYNFYRLIKYNNLGDFQLKQDISNSWFIEFYSIAVDSSDNVYVAGKIQPSTEDIGDFYLKKVDNLGKEKWSYSWNIGTGDYCYVVDLNSVDDIFVAGITGGDLYVAKFEENPPSEKKVSEIASYEPLILLSILFATSIIIIISKTKKAIIKNQTK